MENNDSFDFEFNDDEGCWSVTGYYGKAEEIILPAFYEGMPVKKIGDMFSPYNKRMKNVIIPKGFTSIGKRAFKGCTGLTSVKLPESITSIEEWAFCGCTGLTSIKLPESLTSIETYAFSNCTGLTNIKLPDGLTSVEDWAFNECTGLTNIKLPGSLTSIRHWAFPGCPGLAGITVDENNSVFCALDGVMFDKAMTMLMWFPEGKKGGYSVPDGVMRIISDAFMVSNLTSISFPQSLISIESSEFNGDQLTDITVNELNPEYCSIDGVLFDKEKKKLLAYPKNKDKTDYTVPDGIRLINSCAFNGCKHLVNIHLPESLELIGDCAFTECEGLKAITLPMNLQYVQENAFQDCQNLETITLSKRTKIIWDQFLAGLYGRKRLVYINLPESPELIGDFMFAEREGNKTITLPMNLRYVEERTFEDFTIPLSRGRDVTWDTAFEGFTGQLIYRD
ncbi:MAG: leucine-rich repeat domain-containing protein [Treponema sp.]|jgi:hypothetical protein|nr:leucine-rich repeat domain-containing protein [Treponema sp.]